MGVPTRWQPAGVTSIRRETSSAKTIGLRPAVRLDHLPGQHLVVRLTAPDGYTASRSYSIASAPGPASDIEITVERLPDGEVSTFLHDELLVSDEIEIRGPIGEWFTWRGDGPTVLVGGGSGVVPLMAMLRSARARRTSNIRMVVSIRTAADLYYADELPGPEVTIVYTRVSPPGSARPPGRLTAGDLRPIVLPDATAYVCGSSGFVDAATRGLLEAGVPVDRIRTERFGPTT